MEINLNTAQEALDKLKKERERREPPKSASHPKVKDAVPGIQDQFDHISQCCPDVRDREKIPHDERQKSLINDLIEQTLLNYPEELRDSIRAQVAASLNS